jgi:serine/threonine-protein kinase
MCAAANSATRLPSDLAPTLPEGNLVDALTLTSDAVPTTPWDRAQTGAEPTRGDSWAKPRTAELIDLSTTKCGTRYTGATTLGQGGMGEVRMCMDHRTRRHIAMKVMRPELARKPDARALFVREALAQARLEHPSIVPVYDVGLDGDDELYFTMRRVHGSTLEEVIRHLVNVRGDSEQEYSRHRLLSAFASVCLAVHYAHTRDVLHCDLKPANIMLGAFGEVYVLDWGLAARATRDSARFEKSVAGTLGYMPPEQLRGVPPDARADVYALGATLYEILTLEPLHSGTVSEVYARTLAGAVQKPSCRAPLRDIAPELDEICMKATASDRDDRYGTVRELHDALDRYMAGDRDLVLRREMSKAHTREALTAIQRSQSSEASDLKGRSDALRAVGRALAFDPENKEALRTLVELITDAPANLPAEALSEIWTDERAFQQTRTRAALVGCVCWIVLLPGFLWIGSASVRAVLASMVAHLALTFVLYRRMRQPCLDGCSPPHEAVLASIAVALTSAVANPFVTAVFATVAAMGFGLAVHPRHRYVPLVSFTLSVIAPWSINTAWGASPPGALVSNPLILIVMVANIAVACLFAARLRERLRAAQRRAYTTAWQLRQLLPHEASAMTTSR